MITSAPDATTPALQNDKASGGQSLAAVKVITSAPDATTPALQNDKTAPDKVAILSSAQTPVNAQPRNAEPTMPAVLPVPPTLLPKATVESETPSFSITRQQVSAQDLVKKKVDQAQQALEINDIQKAESLLEEALLVLPGHKQARLRLAALWFGRQAHQDALNLLSQGLHIDPQDSELRLMQARIYIKQGRSGHAYQVLSVLDQIKEIEYQSALASIGQQTGQFAGAVSSYLILLELEPDNGRWWLGLGAAYDSNSEFTLASQAYQSALLRGGLSPGSITFVKTRMQVLGK